MSSDPVDVMRRRLESYRYQHRTSYRVIADRAGVSQQVIQRIRRGENVTVESLAYLAEAMGMPLWEALKPMEEKR